MKLRLTDMAIKKLPHPAQGQVTHWDELTPGFGLRCSTKSKSFVVMYGERRQLKTIGRYPKMSLSDARAQAKRFFVQHQDGAHGEHQHEISFDEAKDRFLEDCRNRNKPRTVADYTRHLDKHFRFAGNLGDVSRQQVMKVVSGLSNTPSEQSHAYVAIRTMMNWCVRHGLVEQSVVPQIKQGTTARNRVLSEGELRNVFLRSQETPFPFGPIMQLLILTGQRRTEVGSLRRTWISNGYIVFPAGFTKNKREHRFPLSGRSQEIIEGLPDTGDLLFPAATNNEKTFSGWAWHKARFDEGLEDVAPYTLHDLRRTFATVHAKIGTPIHVTEKLLNHVTGTISGVAAVYNQHTYEEEKREAMARFDEYIAKLIET
ncbi:tyrosine-type recombinase/integrase [Thiosulfatihalobacter marinus]|uniref:tyrosine-type recombinase/integrase n=1 Tax=Thiosulfatihalobacter marinus TaxID=2792481 RepID=UPI0018D7C9C6